MNIAHEYTQKRKRKINKIKFKKLTGTQSLLRWTNSFRRDLKTFLFHSVYGHQDMD